jgi:NADPH:quinone reductase-like Zn-dependent oxidoreductase
MEAVNQNRDYVTHPPLTVTMAAVFNASRLRGKSVIITGASSGIGAVNILLVVYLHA